jgi:hypothetical protein
MRTKESIFEEIKSQGYITKSQIQALKKMSERNGVTVYKRTTIPEFKSKGIPVTFEQGEQGLRWLRKIANKRKAVVDERTKNLIFSSSARDFHFQGFTSNFMPIYELNGLVYSGFGDSITVM